MFKKTLILILFTIFAYSKEITTAIIDKVENGYAYAHIVDNSYKENDLKNGALIIKDIGNNSIIVARANFISFEENTLKLELYTFSDLKQDALPLPILAPQIGDRVMINNYIDHTLLIAPNKESYEYITKTYNNFRYFDINVFAASLYSKSLIIPSRNDLRNFCKTWAIGSIMFAHDNKIKLYECSSLNKISEFEIGISNLENENINFYSNISKQLSKKTDYFSYYNDLFKEKE